MEWISVKNRLPEKDSYVSFVSFGRVFNGKYETVGSGEPQFTHNAYRDDYWGKGAEEMIARKVTYWMPLRKPPEE